MLESRRLHGSNLLTQLPPTPLWKRFLLGFRDPMLVILLVALVIQAVLFLLGKAAWFEPFGVFVAILLANGVAAISEHIQAGKASALKAEAEGKERAKVLRDGSLQELQVRDVVVGDIVSLQAGDKIPADGLVCQGAFQVDQSALNGESEEAPKSAGTSCDLQNLMDPHAGFRGTVLGGGEGLLQIQAVGDKTLFGALALEVQGHPRPTPLQVKLTHLAKQITLFGYIGACAIVAGILGQTFLTGNLPESLTAWIRLLLDAITVAVTIVVCAVPEGLPMLTSILLSLQSMRMIRDNILIHRINGLETAGSLSILFCDKTGTITEGRLAVAELATADATPLPSLSSLPEAFRNDLAICLGRNNSARVSNGNLIGGNSTDRALLAFLKENHSLHAETLDVCHSQPFDSIHKYSSLTIRQNGARRIFQKGAPEALLPHCTHFCDAHGQIHPLPDQNALTAYLDAQAARSFRLLAATVQEEHRQILLAIISIRDNVRQSVAEAVHTVQGAGIQVVMVTGDRHETASAIAREAGLLREPDDLALPSAQLANSSDEELKALLPRLRVVSRALPGDKSRLVRLAQELSYVVGMTGDGVNDAPALRKADVGFAMGSGTEVAKEAGDITILDDNFASISKAILYGRTMFKSIRKFLVFQLTVNVAAVLVCFLGPLFGQRVVLTVIQLLLVNLAMDTLAAIAFGSEPALPEFMKEKPVPREAGMVTGEMFQQILVSSFYITAVCLALLFCPFVQNWFTLPRAVLAHAVDSPAYASALEMFHRSMVFATFMMAIACNGFNARAMNRNPFAGLSQNRNFLLVMATIFLMQFLFITFGGEFLQVEPLPLRDWLLCALLALLVIPVATVTTAFRR